jgi:hypothetical protein
MGEDIERRRKALRKAAEDIFDKEYDVDEMWEQMIQSAEEEKPAPATRGMRDFEAAFEQESQEGPTRRGLEMAAAFGSPRMGKTPRERLDEVKKRIKRALTALDESDIHEEKPELAAELYLQLYQCMTELDKLEGPDPLRERTGPTRGGQETLSLSEDTLRALAREVAKYMKEEDDNLPPPLRSFE